jgi:hypothetical protein
MTTELEEVVEKIRNAEAQLAKVEQMGLDIADPKVMEYMTSLNNKLTKLYDEKARLSPSEFQ